MTHRPRQLSEARARALGPLLDRFERGFDKRARLGFDPVELPRRHADPADQEVAGLFAAALAYGRADLFKPVLERALAEMGPSPASFCERFARSPHPAFEGFLYRFNRPADLRALAAAVGHLRREHGSLGARFAALLRETRGEREPLRSALARFGRELREAPPARAQLADRGARGLAHLLPDAALPGPCKRWNLYLRWMVRGPDEVDLGAWRGVPASALVVPLDTHLARVARYLGLTDRSDMSWRTAAEITGNLRRLDPADPVRFDFVLCHLGMSGACPLRRDPARCAVCPLSGECRAKARPPPGAGRGRQRPAPPPPAAATTGGSCGG
ncbi:MAG TPA: TIGR02757 family protein [Anaeromyxobacteraceae bacterium]|nr:TIGR02757 family protein [Anaeromyxobacteraceae bacterium]